MGRSALAFAALVLAVGACRITPDEIAAIETENELLREQIQAVKENCTYYREVEVEPDEAGEAGEPR